MSKNYFYEKNPIIKSEVVNVTFEDLLFMTEPIFKAWVKTMRKALHTAWDKYDVPCKSGRTEDEIIKEFDRLSSYPVHKFAGCADDSTEQDIINNTGYAGSCVDQFFPTMMKVPINYSMTATPYAIYDLVSNDKYQESVEKRCRRHFKRDGFYHYSMTLKVDDKKNGVVPAKTAEEWLDIYCDNTHIFKDYDFWISETKGDVGVSTGYNQVDTKDLLGFSKDSLLKNIYKFTLMQCSNIDVHNLKDECRYDIRFYKKGQKIFPAGFKSFKIGYCQAAGNFPPMSAKYLYEKYTEHCKSQDVINIWDPSAGWGGRILGAMTVEDGRVIHYIGTDVNMDNWIPELNQSRYAYLADFVNTKSSRSNPFFTHQNTYEIFMIGSEVVQFEEGFKKYKGELDFVFTSPPYFTKEQYSDDEAQSCNKYGSSYNEWRDGFLEPTIKTICEWLKHDRYAAWNIADVKYGKVLLPLEDDSISLFKKYGMNYVRTEKMILKNMPGANRLSENGKSTTKNTVMFKGNVSKFEPIFLFYKGK